MQLRKRCLFWYRTSACWASGSFKHSYCQGKAGVVSGRACFCRPAPHVPMCMRGIGSIVSMVSMGCMGLHSPLTTAQSAVEVPDAQLPTRDRCMYLHALACLLHSAVTCKTADVIICMLWN